MKTTDILMDEHQVILRRLVALIVDLEMPLSEAQDRVREHLWFIQSYADAFHHGKEEDIYFAWMRSRMAELGREEEADTGPLGCMFKEHELGREFVRAAQTALDEFSQDASQEEVVKKNLTGFIQLLSDHIYREDYVVYRMAEELDEGDGDAVMLEAFRQQMKAEADVAERALAFDAAFLPG